MSISQEIDPNPFCDNMNTFAASTDRNRQRFHLVLIYYSGLKKNENPFSQKTVHKDC